MSSRRFFSTKTEGWGMGLSAMLVHFGASLLDHLAPALDLGADPFAELLGGARDHLEFDCKELVAHLRRIKDSHDFPMVALDDGPRRAAGGEEAYPRHGDEIGESRLDHRRHVRRA